ncbi:MAG: hypothetical protein Kow0068_23350 [Marinilabiliales bacterium]
MISCKIQEVNIGNVKNIEMHDIDQNKMSLQLDIPIKNQNNFKFKITKVNLDVTLNNNNLGKVKRLNKITVPAKSNQVHSFILEVKYKDLMKNPFSMLGGFLKNRAEIQIDGYVKVRAFLFVTKKFEIHENSTSKLINRKK